MIFNREFDLVRQLDSLTGATGERTMKRLAVLLLFGLVVLAACGSSGRSAAPTTTTTTTAPTLPSTTSPPTTLLPVTARPRVVTRAHCSPLSPAGNPYRRGQFCPPRCYGQSIEEATGPLRCIQGAKGYWRWM